MKSLTFDEFLAALPALGPWALDDKGAIRRVGGCVADCSLEHAACVWNVSVDQNDNVAIDVIVGGRHIDASIWRANDNAPGHDPAIRAALLRACGLEG